MHLEMSLLFLFLGAGGSVRNERIIIWRGQANWEGSVLLHAYVMLLLLEGAERIFSGGVSDYVGANRQNFVVLIVILATPTILESSSSRITVKGISLASGSGIL